MADDFDSMCGKTYRNASRIIYAKAWRALFILMDL